LHLAAVEIQFLMYLSGYPEPDLREKHTLEPADARNWIKAG